jgi:hypothetical protein
MQYREARESLADFMSGSEGEIETRDAEYNLCMGFIMLWIIIIIIFTMALYNFAVRGLDKGNYKVAKNWTLVGIIVGFAGGIIPLIIFIISYVSFDDAIRNQQFGQMQYRYPSYPMPVRYCIKCKRQIPPDSRLCPYCGANQESMGQTGKRVPPHKIKKTASGQNRKPLPPPPKSYKEEQ